ncbi:GTPase HflX [Phormidium tenue FACHB-886]|nr:GTPase HflX [Phormidium tenue FACHB-886]
METIYGNLQGIKSSQIKQLQKLYEQRQPSDRITTPEFAQQLASLSQAIHQPLCSYINRRGQIVRVGVGTPAQTQLALADLPRQSSERLSGIRCLTVQPQAPDPASLVAMARQRLDALMVLQTESLSNRKHRNGTGNRDGEATGEPIKAAYLAHLVPDFEQPWSVSEPLTVAELAEADFSGLVREWETELREAGFDLNQLQPHTSDRDRVLLVGLMTADLSEQQFQDGLAELERLVESAGGEVVGITHQKRSQPHPQTVVGQGKVEEIALQSRTAGATLVVFDRVISASQARNLEEQIGLRVVDRTEVILDIFAQRAQSQAGKLQVELAQLEYQLPRLRGRGQEMSRLGAGIGTRGPGETKLETERRTIQRRIAQLQQEVNQLQAHRSRLRQQREQQTIPTIALVGYTNAGKSTLLNVLTHAEVYTADQLFATLDPTTRRLSIGATEERRDILLTDTVGFIHHLPPALMDAFRATLEEVTEADALLHVVDLSHPARADQIRSVEEILSDLPALPGPALLTFNKIDRVDAKTLSYAQQLYPDAAFISATERQELDTLKQRLLQLINDLQ